MIKINVQSEDILQRNRMVADVVNKLRNRSFTERHPELGRKINCAICGLRHYQTRICVPTYATHNREGIPYREEESPMVAPQTRKGIYGAAAFAHKRFHPHRHPVVLEILHRAEESFAREEESLGLNGQPDMTVHINRAKKLVQYRIDTAAKKARQRQKESQRTNR